MQLITVVAITSLAASVSAYTPANPFVKHVAARVVNIDGSYGIMAKRQTSCPAGLTACGTGCSAGPCCDAAAGLACRANETCQTVNGQLACCPNGYTCDAVRTCENAIGGCVPGSVTNGALCCDATAPLCLTSSSTPYCAGVAPSTTYTVAPPAQTSGSGSGAGSTDSTTTLSVTSTSTQTLTAGTTSDAMPSASTTVTLPTETLPASSGSATSGAATSSPASSGSTETVVILPTGYTTAVLTVISGSSTYTTTATLSPTSYTQVTVSATGSESSSATSGSGSGSSGSETSGTMMSTSTATATATISSTSTYTAIISVYPTMNGTYGNATATMVAPTQATGAASRFSVNAGCALGAVMGLFYLL